MVNVTVPNADPLQPDHARHGVDPNGETEDVERQRSRPVSSINDRDLLSGEGACSDNGYG